MPKASLVTVLAGLALLGLSMRAFAIGEAAEAEAARHHAQAGGPVNDRDRDLLARYGCFSDTTGAFCSKLAGRPAGYERPARHPRRRAH